MHDGSGGWGVLYLMLKWGLVLSVSSKNSWTKLLWGLVGYFGLGLGFWGLGWVSGGVVTASTIFNNISSTANSAICVASRQVGVLGLVCGGGWVFFGVVGGFVDARFLSSNALPSLEMFMQTISNFFANLAFNFSPVFLFTNGWALFGQLIFCPNITKF